MPFRVRRLEIPDIVFISAETLRDDRGFFLEVYKRSEFAARGIPDTFVQDNFSSSRRGILRGLHYQKHPKAQGKLVMVLRGEIFDVAVDLRGGSPTYGRWVGVGLSAQDRSMLYVPVGFAHGFCVVSEDADVLYKVTEEYAPEYERGVIWNDPQLAIPWPIRTPHLSARDARLPLLAETDNNFVYDGGAR